MYDQEKDTHLCIPRVGVKYVREEFGGHGDPSNNQPVDIVAVDCEKRRQQFHSIKVYDEADKYFIRRRAVPEYSNEVIMYADRRNGFCLEELESGRIVE